MHCFGKGKVLSWHFGVAQSDELTQVGDGQSGPQLALNAVLAREDSLGLRTADQHTEAGCHQTVELWKEQYIIASKQNCEGSKSKNIIQYSIQYNNEHKQVKFSLGDNKLIIYVKVQSQKTLYNAVYSTTMSTNKFKLSLA